jgi:hypothetical protein
MENTAKKGFWGTFKEKHPAVDRILYYQQWSDSTSDDHDAGN